MHVGGHDVARSSVRSWRALTPAVETWDCSREEHQRSHSEQNPSKIVQSSRIEKSCRIVSAVLDWYIPGMTFLRHRWTSRRHPPLWVLLLGMRQPCAEPCASDDGGVGASRHRWKRSLRAPMVLRVCWRLGGRRDAPDRAGQLA